MKGRIAALTTALAFAAPVYADAVSEATTAMTSAKTQGESIIALGFGVVASLGVLWLGMRLVKKLIAKVG